MARKQINNTLNEIVFTGRRCYENIYGFASSTKVNRSYGSFKNVMSGINGRVNKNKLC